MKLLFQLLIITQVLFISCDTNKEEIIEVPLKGGIPEGIAVDKAGNIYLANLYTKDIVKCDADGSNCQVIQTKYTGKLEGLGMVVYEDKLYALGNENGYESRLSVLQIIDLKSLKLKESYEWRDTIPTFFNDLTIHKGKPYITNTLQHAIYTITEGQFTPLLKSQEIRYPNGITSSVEDHVLFIASSKGIRTLDLTTSSFLNEPDTTLRGIDGLKLIDEKLVAVQNGSMDKKDHSVLELKVDQKGMKISLVSKHFENHPYFDIPTTLSINGRSIYALMNSQMEQLEDGEISHHEDLTNTYVMKFTIN